MPEPIPGVENGLLVPSDHTHVFLAHSGLRVSRLVFGCEPLGGADWGSVDIGAIQRAAMAALDAGINFFDTAGVYGLGESERNLRKALGSRIKEAVICTKIGLSWHSVGARGRASVYRDAKPTSLCHMVEASLTRLGVEHLQVVLIHWPDPETPLECSMEALGRLREQGKIGDVGVSNFSSADIRQAHQSMALSMAQVQYSLLRRECAGDIIPTCRSLGIGAMAWGVLAQGLLTGKYSQDSAFSQNDRRRTHPNFDPVSRRRGCLMNERLRVIAQRHAARPAQVAVRWVLDQAGVSAAIVGIKDCNQLHDMTEAAMLRLTTEDYLLLNAELDSSTAPTGDAHAN
jgi:aryl-alcohol dehydrogenase-like predicted oxidoreductase